MNTVTLHVIGQVFFATPALCGDVQPCDMRFTWHNTFPTIEACQAEKERRIRWLQLTYRFVYAQPPDYICTEGVFS